MPIDINAIIAETRGKNFELYEDHVNPVFVKVLRMLGFNRTWVRGEGPYLWDEYWYPLSGFSYQLGCIQFRTPSSRYSRGIAAGLGLRFSWLGRFRRSSPRGRAGS